jgi:predicted aldo/keto reductase-like oxidoreductase
MQYRLLGSTGERVSIVGLGGFHLSTFGVTEAEAVRIVRTALDEGLNFLDNCWDYNDGESERRAGKALRNGYRAKAFLMTKLDGRTKASAAKQLEESLDRLQTDSIDLVQVHEVIRRDDAERVFAEGGAIEALLDAKAAGKLRYIGFTGHKSPEIHLHMLEVAARHGFKFDAVQLPVNVMDAHYHSFARGVLPVLGRDGIGALGMKPMGDAIILRTMVVTPVECLRYALSQDVDAVITGCDSMRVLRQALEVAHDFKPLTSAESGRILERTKEFAVDGKYELYKTATGFDGTTHNPSWLG